MKNNRTKFITIRATGSLTRRVADLARKEKRTLSYMAYLLLEEALNARLLMTQALESLKGEPK